MIVCLHNHFCFKQIANGVAINKLQTVINACNILIPISANVFPVNLDYLSTFVPHSIQNNDPSASSLPHFLQFI